MAYGLRIINDNSELLVDSELVNPTFVQKLEFNPTTTYTENNVYDGSYNLYIRRDYATNSFSVASGGAYIILWALPDAMTPGQPEKDVWYSFKDSAINMSRIITCSVYSNAQGTPTSYLLPTAYIFAINAQAVNGMASSGYALRMYNSSQVKTFDSSLVQLVPYSITNSFALSGTVSESLYLPVPTNPIYLLPKSSLLFVGDNGNVPNYSYQRVFEACFRHRGQYIDAKMMSTSFTDGNPPIGETLATFFAGNVGDLSVISADSDFYQSATPGTGGGNNPTYTLSASATLIDEGQSVTITLTTTQLPANTNVPYSITGITGDDLTVGSLTGNFVLNNSGTATINLTLANDLKLEGTETIRVSLNNLPYYLDITVRDTSKPNVIYQFSTPAPINEGSTGYNTFSATNALGKVVTFSIVAPLSGTAVNSADGTLDTTTWTVPSNSTSSINVFYTANADQVTEPGVEAFRIAAIVDGIDVATSGDIVVNDTSKSLSYGISAADTWTEGTSNAVTITATNAPPGTIYLNTSDPAVPKVDSVFVTGTDYSTTLYYNTAEIQANTVVTLYVRTGSLNGPIVAQKTITVLNVAASYSFGGVSSINEGTNSSVNLFYSNSGGKVISFQVIAPEAGYVNGSGDVTLTTTTHTVSSDAAGSVSVAYSVAADSQTEGPEGFRIIAVVDGSTRASTGTIVINDTSTALVASLTANGAPWTESTNQTTSFNIQGAQNKLVQLTSSTGYVSPDTSLYFVNSDNYTATTVWTIADVPDTFYATLYLRDYYTNQTYAQTTVQITNVPPVPIYNLYNTWTSLANGASGAFFLRSYNANGTPVIVSVSGAGAGRISVSPTSFTIGSNAQTDTYIGVAATTPTSAVPDQSVTISLSTGQSFSFTVPAFNPATAPLVSSVTYPSTTVYAGEDVFATINFNGPITADTYVRVEVNAGVYGTGNNVFVGGSSELPIGSYTGNYTTVQNPGLYFTTLKVGARAETLAGATRQSYIYGPTVNLSKLAAP